MLLTEDRWVAHQRRERVLGQRRSRTSVRGPVSVSSDGITGTPPDDASGSKAVGLDPESQHQVSHDCSILVCEML